VLAVVAVTRQSGYVATAQDAFDRAVREVLRPHLKALEFTGAGMTFTHPGESHFAMIGLQKSQFSDRRSLKFTANITVVGKDAWAARRTSKSYLPARPAPNTFYGSDVWQVRIGMLLPGGEDMWWSITDDVDAATAVDELQAAITTYVLPEMHARLGA
jgi:hypothetical protein